MLASFIVISKKTFSEQTGIALKRLTEYEKTGKLPQPIDGIYHYEQLKKAFDRLFNHTSKDGRDLDAGHIPAFRRDT